MTDSYPNSNMAPKYITIAGEEEEANEHAQLKGALLGVKYDIKVDRICISFPPTYRTKGRGATKTPVHLSPPGYCTAPEWPGKVLPKVRGILRHGPLRCPWPDIAISLRTKLLLRKSHVATESCKQEIPKDFKRESGAAEVVFRPLL